MRFILDLELKKEQFPLDFRKCFLSLFKHVLSNYLKGNYLEKYYSPGVSKPFCFAVGLGKSQFIKQHILIPAKKIKCLFSSSDVEAGIVFYNALLEKKYQWYPLPEGNEMRIMRISFEKEEVITSKSIEVKFLAPLCVRAHNKEANKDRYYSVGEDGFDEALKTVLIQQLAQYGVGGVDALKEFSLAPMQCKKTVVRHHGQFVQATIGTFRMHGDIRILNHLYLAGMGSRSSASFGVFEILKQGGD